MINSFLDAASRLALRRSGMAAATALLAVAACTPITPSDNANDNTPTGPVMGEIVNLRSNISISALGQPISILYSVSGEPDGVVGYYVRSDIPDSEPVIIASATNLSPGTNRSFNFNPQGLSVGSYKVGVQVTSGTVVQDFRSSGTILIEGPPNPRFIQPAITRTQVTPGSDVLITFDAGDPEGQVQWRLFYLTSRDSRDVTPDRLGTQLSVGSGNVGSFVLSTTGLAVGDYEIGLSATDSGFSIATTVAQGETARIVTIPSATVAGPILEVIEQDEPMPPSLSFTAPGTNNVELFGNEGFTIQFSGVVREAGATGQIDIFYDDDTDCLDGFTFIAENLPATAQLVSLPTDLAEGTYRIGGIIRDGINPQVCVYAGGSVTIVRTPTLTVTAPNTTLPIAPSTQTPPEITVPVTWTTNVPAASGRAVQVVAQMITSTGQQFGQEIVVLPSTSVATTSTSFGAMTPGLYTITVRITFADGSNPTLSAQAPLPVRITSLPGILWVGSLATASSNVHGAIFEGVNFEDNAGTSFASVDDVNGDSIDEYVIAARYGKPFFTNPTGIGPGEAYLIFGASGASRPRGVFRLNSVGTSRLPGVTFTGVRTPQASNTTDGMSSVTSVPDVDGDGSSELVFGFPNTDSRGHNVDPEQNGVVNPRSLATLEREKQFLRGGIVLVSSQNSALSSPSTANTVINLDMVGQDFEDTCVGPEPDGLNAITTEFGAAMFAQDIYNPMSDPPCDGDCDTPQGGGAEDANGTIAHGFALALARDFHFSYVYSFDFFGGATTCAADINPFVTGAQCFPLEYCKPFPSACEPFSPGLHASDFVLFELDPDTGLPLFARRSGYYRTFTQRPGQGGMMQTVRNQPVEPFGARIIGVGINDRFGTSMTFSSGGTSSIGDIIVSSPGRTARGILLGPSPGGCIDPPSCGGEIDGLESSPGSAKTNPDSGVAYLFGLRSLWTDDAFGQIPPKPHQYIVGEGSHCGGPLPTIPNISAIRIAGFSGDAINNIVGIDDFNDDGRNDIAVGAPTANNGQGRVYIGFRRDPALEGDYVLEKLSLDPTSPDRLAGVLITSTSADGLGSSLTSGVDFNGDGVSDLVIGSPDARNGVGEIIVVFGDPNFVSPLNGVTVQSLLGTRSASGRPRAARITGNLLDLSGRFGFNVANAGDVDGDGRNDLLVAAPGASPRFDDNPTDGMDTLTTPGLDLNFDGLKDDVSGPFGIADGVVDTNDNLANAGIVYLISSRNRLDLIAAADVTINITQLGTTQLRGFMVVGRRSGDRLGGGDAGDTVQGGNSEKDGRGRSYGLASAGDVDGDGRADILLGSILADPRIDPNTGMGVRNGGEAYILYGSGTP